MNNLRDPEIFISTENLKKKNEKRSSEELRLVRLKMNKMEIKDTN